MWPAHRPIVPCSIMHESGLNWAMALVRMHKSMLPQLLGCVGGGFRPNTRLITCRSSKEHQDLNPAGECKGSKYVRTCSHLESPMFLWGTYASYQSSVREPPPLPYTRERTSHTNHALVQTVGEHKHTLELELLKTIMSQLAAHLSRLEGRIDTLLEIELPWRGLDFVGAWAKPACPFWISYLYYDRCLNYSGG